ncbi:MAG: hypothetical protein ABI197_03165, partial [Granulicella sp.]
ADDAAGEHVHDQHHPMASQQNRFDTEQVDTPEGILGMTKQGQPRRTIDTGLVAVVFGEHAAHHILVDLDIKGVRDLLDDSQAPNPRLRR